ncbi:GIY-YIG nuclease family protein [Amylibacter sp. IMCC11727]|uniref:GIY-YIG nuclease family protein n=1 Tax=Amylibacter sp. IMCC11727 TaxID=3039851 RepID=UPI00244E1B6C|nr:GIY-YIG nuclease family protein [Amylibacter sp. IMCC11727]WGI21363.1 GIY-YIG nuclease family protein [Amylibacter sp. IMCC11727]
MNSHTYILASRPQGAIYIGVTNNLIRRIYEHKQGLGSAHTLKYNIKRLVWFEAYDDITEAIKREKRLKKYKREWKINLIEAGNPHWQDLWEDIIQ